MRSLIRRALATSLTLVSIFGVGGEAHARDEATHHGGGVTAAQPTRGYGLVDGVPYVAAAVTGLQTLNTPTSDEMLVFALPATASSAPLASMGETTRGKP